MRQAMKKSFFLVLIAIILMGQGCIAGSDSTSVSTTEGGEIDFTLQDFDGNEVSLSDFKGKVVFLDFWAAWCPFCVGELPEIEQVHQTYGDIVVIGVHRTNTESLETGRKFAEERGVTYTLLQDSDGSVYDAFTGGRPFMPVAVFIDKEGKVQDTLFGPKTSEQIRTILDKLR